MKYYVQARKLNQWTDMPLLCSLVINKEVTLIKWHHNNYRLYTFFYAHLQRTQILLVSYRCKRLGNLKTWDILVYIIFIINRYLQYCFVITWLVLILINCTWYIDLYIKLESYFCKFINKHYILNKIYFIRNFFF